METATKGQITRPVEKYVPAWLLATTARPHRGGPTPTARRPKRFAPRMREGKLRPMIGSSLGPYKILEKIGAGGMGEVYLAEDTRLNRKVAIKTLPEEFASDPERLARFEQEAKAAAALNHPHIAVVHDIGFQEGLASDDMATNPNLDVNAIPASGVHYIVQEYLRGDTLREPLNKGALPLAKSLLYNGYKDFLF